ncbi:MAG: ABC transporter permease [Thermodesulfobacteriota bacterium]|nr:ABC transporter permease [Thermodesulfobacteriota bacterium]
MRSRRLLCIHAFARMETLYIIRDPRSLGFAFIIPLILLILFGSSLSYDVKDIPLTVWDQDKTPQSRHIISAFRGSPYYRIVGLRDSYRQIQDDIDTRKASTAIIIPQKFSKAMGKGQKGSIQFIIDGTDSTTAGVSSGYITGIIQKENLETLSSIDQGSIRMPSINPICRVWFNPTMESKNFIIPGLIGVILATIASLLSSLTIAREWETGTIETIISLPARPIEIVIGKMVPYFVIGMIDVTLLIFASVFIFNIPIHGSIALIYAFSTVFTIGTLGLGIVISGVAKNQAMANQIAIISTFLPSLLLSGFVFPIKNMPIFIQGITYLVPARYLINALKDISLKGLGMEELYLSFLLLTAFAIAMIFVAASKIPRRIK